MHAFHHTDIAQELLKENEEHVKNIKKLSATVCIMIETYMNTGLSHVIWLLKGGSL